MVTLCFLGMCSNIIAEHLRKPVSRASRWILFFNHWNRGRWMLLCGFPFPENWEPFNRSRKSSYVCIGMLTLPAHTKLFNFYKDTSSHFLGILCNFRLTFILLNISSSCTKGNSWHCASYSKLHRVFS